MVTRLKGGAKSMPRYFAPSIARLFSGTRRVIPILLWTLVGFLFVLYLYTLVPGVSIQSEDTRTNLRRSHNRPLLRDLEVIEEEHIHLPPPKKRSPRAVKRKPKPKRPNTLIDEFLDETSPIRHVFFPTMKTAVGPTKDAGNDSLHYYPGRIWLDTEGNPIQAHGGGILYDERSMTYYWYGEYKDGPTYHAHKRGAARVDIIGVGCYSSKDLWAWKNEGIVLAAEQNDETHDLHKSNVLERPKVIHNAKPGKYVMWMHVDDVNYTRASVGIATSDSPTGPFLYLHSYRPHEYDSRDMTIFKDDDDVAYLVYSSINNSELHVSPLTDDYLGLANFLSRILIGHYREAPALFKHDGTYYMITSGCTGWAPNGALVHATDEIMGPWETMGNPCVGGNEVYRRTTFFGQGTFVLPLVGFSGSFVFMADRWDSSDLGNSRYVWLPMTVGGAADDPLDYGFGFPWWSRVSVYWHRRWRIPEEWSGNKL